jgi:hypothetical protein
MMWSSAVLDVASTDDDGMHCGSSESIDDVLIAAVTAFWSAVVSC